MIIDMHLDKDFENCLDKLKEKYGEEFDYLNGLHESQLNFSTFIDNFIDKNVADVSIDANANAHHKDIATLAKEKCKSEDKIHALNKLFYEMKKFYGVKTAERWLEAEWSGAFYMHDCSSSTFFSYCFAYDLTKLATEGLFFLEHYNNKPPKHLTTFIDNTIEFISYFSNRTSGACGIPNFLLWCMYYYNKDVEAGYYIKDKDYYIRQCFQKFIYRINQPFMRIDQSAFVNVSIFDKHYYNALFGGVEFPDGTFAIDYVNDFISIEKIFMEVVSDIRSENMFTFPVLTYSLLKKKMSEEERLSALNKGIETGEWNIFVDNDFARWCSDHNMKWNDSNFFMSDNVGTLSNCCRLLSDTSKLDAFINSIGGTALSIGSVKVNTINLMCIAYESMQDEDKFLKILNDRVLMCCKILNVQRHIIKRNVEKGLLPNVCDGGVDLSKCYSTVGILGLYEAIEYFGYINKDSFDHASYSKKGITFAEKIFEVINYVKDNFTTQYSLNVESVPAENCAIILAQKDKLLYKGTKDIYSNQWIPLSQKCTIDEKLRTASILDNKCSGGAIAHINIESNFPTSQSAWDMLNYIACKDVIYFAFNTRINECENHHGFVGSDICPNCGKPVIDTYQRIVGFLQPVRTYSSGRKKEFNTRQWYSYAELRGE